MLTSCKYVMRVKNNNIPNMGFLPWVFILNICIQAMGGRNPITWEFSTPKIMSKKPLDYSVPSQPLKGSYNHVKSLILWGNGNIFFISLPCEHFNVTILDLRLLARFLFKALYIEKSSSKIDHNPWFFISLWLCL